jgi:hypothetical protein
LFTDTLFCWTFGKGERKGEEAKSFSEMWSLMLRKNDNPAFVFLLNWHERDEVRKPQESRQSGDRQANLLDN